MRNLKTVVLAVLLAFFFSIGCDQDPSVSDTYPCKYVVYSDLDTDAAITSCEGIGSAYPDGFVRRNSQRSPTKVFFFPRQRSFPKSFRIKWKTIQDTEDGTNEKSEEYVQELEVPSMEKGSEGELRLDLSEENEWSLKFVETKSKKTK